MKQPTIIRAYCASCGLVSGYAPPLPPYCAIHATKISDLSSPPRSNVPSVPFAELDKRFLQRIEAGQQAKK